MKIHYVPRVSPALDTAIAEAAVEGRVIDYIELTKAEFSELQRELSPHLKYHLGDPLWHCRAEFMGVRIRLAD